MNVKSIQVCGTGSGVGKSVISAGLCRIFLQDGFTVAPFKAQNMALNSFVTKEGGEMGRAQAVQAAACRIAPHTDMNPILIKPVKDTKAQIILQGKPVRNMSAIEYKNYKQMAKKSVLDSFNRLKKGYEIIVIEGAGSPAEINLRAHDIVNMEMAKMADAPVILVGDIDKGGVFAWFVGTLELLTYDERKMIKGFIINKFRGDKRLLKGGIDFLEKKTGIPVLGVIPYFRNINIPEEDSVPLEDKRQGANDSGKIDIAVIYLPHISNFTDFDALEREPDVNLYYVSDKDKLKNPDIIIIPGTKNTISDLRYLKESGLAGEILRAISNKPLASLVGICGGYQMLGLKIIDRYSIESNKKETKGLGLLPIVTNFEREKILCQVRAKEIATGLEVKGYEIHHGKTKNNRPIFKIVENRERFDGAISDDDKVWGTYIHGIFDEDGFRRNFLNRIRMKKGYHVIAVTSRFNIDKELDKLSELLRCNLDVDRLYEIVNKREVNIV